MQRQRRKLTMEDRVAIDLRRKDGWGVRAIARELGRSPSVISAEIRRGRDTDGRYAAGPAQAAAAARWDRSGRRAKLAPGGPLFAEVTKLLRRQWSPEQIAGRRKRLEDGAEVYFGAWRREGQESPCFLALSGGADGVRASKAQHAVERLDGDLGFDLLGRPGQGAQGVADHALVSAHSGLRLGPLVVAGGFLPAHAATLGDGLEMTIALRRIGLGRRARHRG